MLLSSEAPWLVEASQAGVYVCQTVWCQKKVLVQYFGQKF
jgi:hypothetical protein